MMEREELIQLYIREYEKEGGKKRPSSVKARGAMEKAKSLSRMLKRTKNSQVTRNALENYHRQINNLYYCGLRYHLKPMVEQIERAVIPELVRLDLALLLPEDERLVGQAFF